MKTVYGEQRRTALLASYTKDEPLVRLGKMLAGAGWALLGSAGTAKYLNDNGIECRDVAEIVGAPILGHRVVTLSREIHAGLLSRDEDAAELEKLGVPRIDLVYVTLYPLEKTIADTSSSPNDVIDKTDIGGPTLLRAAAKGRRLTLSNSAQIDALETFIKKGEPKDEREALTLQFAAAPERRRPPYLSSSADYWERASK